MATGALNWMGVSVPRHFTESPMFTYAFTSRGDPTCLSVCALVRKLPLAYSLPRFAIVLDYVGLCQAGSFRWSPLSFSPVILFYGLQFSF
jgi:hypothetical protein